METLSIAPRAEHLIPESARTIYAAAVKQPRLIEKAGISPLEVILEVLPFIEDIRDYHLSKWVRTAVINENGVYFESDQQKALFYFYENLLPFIDALLAIGNQNIVGEVLPGDVDSSSQPKLLNEKQLANPMSVVNDFCKKFPVEYTRRELWDFLEAGVSLWGNYPTGFCPGFALFCYDKLSCLTEAAYCLNGD